MREQVFVTAPARSNQTGSAWVTATRTTEAEEADMIVVQPKDLDKVNIRGRGAGVLLNLYSPNFEIIQELALQKYGSGTATIGYR